MIAIMLGLALAGGDLETVHARHAQALVELAEGALEERLYLDAERRLFDAREYDGDAAGVDPGLKRLRELRMARVSGEPEVEYKAFLASKDFTRAREAHLEDLAEAEQVTAKAALELAAAAFEAGDAEVGAQALFSAFELNVEERAAKRAIGKKQLEALREEWEASRGLSKLVLGERVCGEELPADQLEGKVVVWRSFSL